MRRMLERETRLENGVVGTRSWYGGQRDGMDNNTGMNQQSHVILTTTRLEGP
jgi:hypothetical protein